MNDQERHALEEEQRELAACVLMLTGLLMGAIALTGFIVSLIR